MDNKEKNQESIPALLLEALKHIVLHNGWLKLLALVISVTLWAGLISQDESLTRDKTFTDVNVSVTGTDTMKRNGYIITSDLDDLLEHVTVVAAVPQRQYDAAEVSTYNVRVDVSRVTATGTQELRLTSTASSTYGRVVSTNPSSIQVEVEEYVARQRIPVRASVGNTPEGWYLTALSVDPTVVTVTGPKTLVESINNARAYLDTDSLEWTEGTMLVSADLVLYNRSGEPMDSDLLEITSDSLNIDSVLMEISIVPSVSYDVRELIMTSGEVAEGYEVQGIRVSPEMITVSARSEVLEQMSEVSLDTRTINIKDLRETTSFQLKVQKPSDDAVLSNDTITVTVEIGEKEE